MSTPPLTRLDNWQKGDKFLASHLQQPVDALRAIAHYGASVLGPPPPPFREMFIGFITDSGPNGESLSDVSAAGEQYWVVKQFIKGGKPWDHLQFGDDDTAPMDPNDSNDDGTITVLATNLPEWQSHSHSLPKGMPVCVFAWWDGGLTKNDASNSNDPGSNQKHYFMWVGAPEGMFPVSLTQSGGANGSATTKATYTYNASRAIGGAALPGGPFAVVWGRSNGLVNVANHGLGYIDPVGGFNLFQVDETEQTSTCS